MEIGGAGGGGGNGPPAAGTVAVGDRRETGGHSICEAWCDTRVKARTFAARHDKVAGDTIQPCRRLAGDGPMPVNSCSDRPAATIVVASSGHMNASCAAQRYACSRYPSEAFASQMSNSAMAALWIIKGMLSVCESYRFVSPRSP